jgi:hypothetical protein
MFVGVVPIAVFICDAQLRFWPQLFGSHPGCHCIMIRLVEPAALIALYIVVR